MDLPVVHRHVRAQRARKITLEDSNYFVFTADPRGDHVGFVQVIEIFEVGGATPPNRHLHADEIFYVLHGQGEALCNGQRIAVTKGDSFLVRAGHEHLVKNTGTNRLYCLTTMVPDEGFAALVRNGCDWPLDEMDMAVLAQATS